MNTLRLFDLKPYSKTFNANVISIDHVLGKEDDFVNICLDGTLFFPESGGQSGDTGYIGNLRIVDTQIDSGVIYHTAEISDAPLPKVGESVFCEIDWERRFSNMQQHTGEHIYSGLVHKMFGYENVGFHLSDDSVTMDYSGKLTWEDAILIERSANEAIFSNLPVIVTFPNKEQLKELTYRSKLSEKEMGDVRIVSIPDVDICACCAPHVKTTGEIGLIKVVDLINHKGGVRISIVCGMRALLDYDKKHNIVKSASSSLSVPPEEIVDRCEKIKSDIKNLEYSLRDSQIATLNNQLENMESNVSHPTIFTLVKDEPSLRNAINSLTTSHNGYCMVFSGNDTDGYRYIIGSSTLDSREVGNILRSHLDAKGGGSPQMIQGQIKNTKDAILDTLRIHIDDFD